MSQWMSQWMNQWMSQWMSQWVSQWVGQWVRVSNSESTWEPCERKLFGLWPNLRANMQNEHIILRNLNKNSRHKISFYVKVKALDGCMVWVEWNLSCWYGRLILNELNMTFDLHRYSYRGGPLPCRRCQSCSCPWRRRGLGTGSSRWQTKLPCRVCSPLSHTGSRSGTLDPACLWPEEEAWMDIVIQVNKKVLW